MFQRSLKKFSNFLTETFLIEEAVDKLKHLTHVEDHPLRSGSVGFGHAEKTLNAVHSHLTGRGTDYGVKVTEKFDGAPAVVFGKHPKTGRFFVGTKSVFNVEPKVNYTDEDIERNHGHSPELAVKLKSALKHLKKISPAHGVYQGDLIHSAEDRQDTGTHITSQPNIIGYAFDKATSEGQRAAASKIGLAVHTKYHGKELENMKAGFDVSRNEFKEHPDVHLINHEIPKFNAAYPTAARTQFAHHMAQARAHHERQDYGALKGHEQHLETYINSTVREGTKPSVKGYVAHLENTKQRTIAGLKKPKAIQEKTAHYDSLISHANENQNQFHNAFMIHGHLQRAKHILVDALSTHRREGVSYSMGGKESRPEGFVASMPGGTDAHGNPISLPSKLVDRSAEGFAAQNLRAGRFQRKALKEQTIINVLIKLYENKKQEKTHVTAFMRGNPLHRGHAEVINTVANEARASGGTHSVVLTHTHDNKKNPLTVEQKLRYARAAFPDINFTSSSPEHPNILHHASNLHSQGHQHLVVVGGSDRDPFGSLLKKYNGQKGNHGYYNFKSIRFVTAGKPRQETPGGTGTETWSASRMRAAAKSGNKAEFDAGAPITMPRKVRDEMYKDTVAGLQETPKKKKK